MTCLSENDLPISFAISAGEVSHETPSLTVPSFKVILIGFLSFAAISASLFALICSKILILWSINSGWGFKKTGLLDSPSFAFFSFFSFFGFAAAGAGFSSLTERFSTFFCTSSVDICSDFEMWKMLLSILSQQKQISME